MGGCKIGCKIRPRMTFPFCLTASKELRRRALFCVLRGRRYSQLLPRAVDSLLVVAVNQRHKLCPDALLYILVSVQGYRQRATLKL